MKDLSIYVYTWYFDLTTKFVTREKNDSQRFGTRSIVKIYSIDEEEKQRNDAI